MTFLILLSSPSPAFFLLSSFFSGSPPLFVVVGVGGRSPSQTKRPPRIGGEGQLGELRKLALASSSAAKRGKTKTTKKRHTFNMLDLGSPKARQGALVLGPRDTGGADRALNVDDRSSHRRAPLAVRDLVRRRRCHVE